MSDQRLLSIAALVIFLMALLLPWPILALGRAEPAIVYAVIAMLTSLLFAWLGRRDSLGRLVLKLAGTAAVVIIGVTGLSIAIRSTERVAAERDTALRAENLAKQAAMEAMMEANARQQSYSVTMVPMSIPVPNAPRVASGPDPMPVVGWPGDGASAEMPVLTATVPSTMPATMDPSTLGSAPYPASLPEAVPPVRLTEAPTNAVTPSPQTASVSLEPAHRLPMTESPSASDRSEEKAAELAGILEGVERWLAEHPLEAVADVTIRQDGQTTTTRMTIGPDDALPTHLIDDLDAATTWQNEFTTGFLGRSLATFIRDLRPGNGSGGGVGWGGIEAFAGSVEDGDGYEQLINASVDSTSGAVKLKERSIRFNLDGRFRTKNRTTAKDFREVAPGIRLPHRIEIDTYDIDPDKPENAIPKKTCSVKVVVEAWRPQGGEATADGLDAAPTDETPTPAPSEGTTP